ncbi:hypothetical protein BD311DRAFT_70791 [Dichomitus squalens]|uniref:Uncharacterized protein n=1 Tax=Dichomitus squalens TaxID=114155 RepID=A0A4Q9M8X5_9APHY|nr:hypothetical protein BD311DRAFT_70791 [Dichomitus squalens]
MRVCIRIPLLMIETARGRASLSLTLDPISKIEALEYGIEASKDLFGKLPPSSIRGREHTIIEASKHILDADIAVTAYRVTKDEKFLQSFRLILADLPTPESVIRLYKGIRQVNKTVLGPASRRIPLRSALLPRDIPSLWSDAALASQLTLDSPGALNGVDMVHTHACLGDAISPDLVTERKDNLLVMLSRIALGTTKCWHNVRNLRRNRLALEQCAFAIDRILLHLPPGDGQGLAVHTVRCLSTVAINKIRFIGQLYHRCREQHYGKNTAAWQITRRYCAILLCYMRILLHCAIHAPNARIPENDIEGLRTGVRRASSFLATMLAHEVDRAVLLDFVPGHTHRTLVELCAHGAGLYSEDFVVALEDALRLQAMGPAGDDSGTQMWTAQFEDVVRNMKDNLVQVGATGRASGSQLPLMLSARVPDSS